jgi:hypothetical protein
MTNNLSTEVRVGAKVWRYLRETLVYILIFWAISHYVEEKLDRIAMVLLVIFFQLWRVIWELSAIREALEDRRGEE